MGPSSPCLVGGLQECRDLTYVDGYKNKGFLHQGCNNPLPHLAFKNGLLKPFEEFGVEGGTNHLFPYMVLQ